MRNQLTASQVAARLGVQLKTVYAYVSRGVLSRTLADDARTSLFDAGEVDRLVRRGHGSARLQAAAARRSATRRGGAARTRAPGHARGLLADADLADHRQEATRGSPAGRAPVATRLAPAPDGGARRLPGHGARAAR